MVHSTTIDGVARSRSRSRSPLGRARAPLSTLAMATHVARIGTHKIRTMTPPAHASCDSDEGDATTTTTTGHRRRDDGSLGLRDEEARAGDDDDARDDDARDGVVKAVDEGAVARHVRCAVEYAMQATGTGEKATTTTSEAREITRRRADATMDALGLPGRAVRREPRVQDVPCDVSVPLPSDDSAYIRYKDMFGAEKKFAKSSTRARAAQTDMYVQDYLERKVYGYAHARVRKSKGRGRGVRKEIVMERTAVGAGRPEDVLDFEGEPARRLAAPPTQSLPATFAVARGVKSGNATAHKPKRLEKPPCTNVGAQKEDSKKRRANVISDSDKPATRSKPPPVDVSRDVEPTAQPIAEPIVPDTIFDGDNWVDEDLMFWDTLIDTPAGQRRNVPRRDDAAQAEAQAEVQANASPALDIEDVSADAPPCDPSRDRTQSPEAPASPSAQTGETPSPTNRDELIEAKVLDAVERRLAVLETRLFHAEREDTDAWRTAFAPGAPHPPPPGVQAGVPSVPTPTALEPKPPALRRAHSQLSLEEERAHDRGGFEAVNAPRLPLSGDGRDDTARGHATRDGKRHASQKSSGQTTDGEQQRREQRAEMSSPAGSRALAELERLHEVVESLQRRQERMEHEREKELARLARAHRDHTAKLESIIAAYESDVDRYSPRLAPNSTSSFRSSPYTPRDQYGTYATPRHHYAGMDPRHDEGDRYASRHHHHTRGGGASAPPTAEAAALEREIASMERAIARKNDVISSLSREFVQSGTRWDRFD